MVPIKGVLASLLMVAGWLATSLTAVADEGAVDPIELFEQRIMPIFRSPKPSSCVQCHLSSVDLKDYILPNHEQTFLSLRDQGLINLDRPEESKILQLIGMGDKDADSYARRIHEKVRKAEYDAFSAWIVACCHDRELRSRPSAEIVPAAGPDRPEPIIEFTRKSRLVDSFVRNVWSQRMRCFPCHTPSEIDPSNPKHQKPLQSHSDFVKEFGQRMNIFKETPEATMRHLIANSKPKPDRLPLINVTEPTKSLLVLKPTSKVPRKLENGQLDKPSQNEPVTHLGGLKMHVHDQSYKSFVAWIEDYAKASGGKYVALEDLPLDNWYPTQHVLRMKNTPSDWDVLGTVQLFVHAWNDRQSTFEEQPMAFTQALVTPRHMVNGSLFLLASKAEKSSPQPANNSSSWKAEGESLPPGKYQIRAFYDAKHLIDENPVAMLGEKDFVGELEVDADWKEGFPNAQVVDGSSLTK